LLLKTIRENGGNGCWEASDVLARFGRTVLPRLRELLDEEDEHARRLAFCTLAKIGTPAVDTLAEALGHRNVEVRHRAASCLSNPEADTASATPDLVRALDDEKTKKPVTTHPSHGWIPAHLPCRPCSTP
jgi:hypothetical protein